MEAGRLVAAHLAQDGLAVELDGLLGWVSGPNGPSRLVLVGEACCGSHVEAWCEFADVSAPMCSTALVLWQTGERLLGASLSLVGKLTD